MDTASNGWAAMLSLTNFSSAKTTAPAAGVSRRWPSSKMLPANSVRAPSISKLSTETPPPGISTASWVSSLITAPSSQNGLRRASPNLRPRNANRRRVELIPDSGMLSPGQKMPLTVGGILISLRSFHDALDGQNIQRAHSASCRHRCACADRIFRRSLRRSKASVPGQDLLRQRQSSVRIRKQRSPRRRSDDYEPCDADLHCSHGSTAHVHGIAGTDGKPAPGLQLLPHW